MASGSGRHLLGGTASVLLAEGLFPLTAMISAAFLARRLAQSDYGLLALAAGIVSWIQWTISTVFSRATIKFVGAADDWRPIGQSVLQHATAFGMVAGAMLAALAGPLADWLDAPRLAGALRLLAIDIPLFTASSAHQVILVGLGGYHRRAAASMTRWITRLVLMVALVAAGLGLTGALLGLIGASVAELLVYRRFVQPRLFGRSSFPLGQMLSYVAPLFVFSMSMRLFDRTDLLMVTLPSLGGGVDRAGIYGAAQQVALLPALFTGAFSPLLLSTLSHQLTAGREDGARLIARNGLRAAVLLLPLAALVAALAGPTVRLFFGERFLPAAPLLALLFLASCARVVVGVGASVLTAIGRPVLCNFVGLPMWAGAVVLQRLVIPAHGADGAAAATAVMALAGALVMLLLIHRAWGILPPAAAVLRALVMSGAVFGLARLLPDSPWWTVPNYLIGAGVIVAGYLVLGEFPKPERQLVGAMLTRQRDAAAP